MVPEDVREEAEKLKKELRHHSYLYYVLDKPEISDYEFDHMYRKLVDIEAKYPELVTPDSPTQRVGGKATDDFQKVRFRKPMLSAPMSSGILTAGSRKGLKQTTSSILRSSKSTGSQ